MGTPQTSGWNPHRLLEVAGRLDATGHAPRSVVVESPTTADAVAVRIQAVAVCPAVIAHGCGALRRAPLLVVTFGDGPASPGDVDDVIPARSAAEVGYLRRALRANARLRGGAASESFLVPPPAEEPPGDLFAGLRVECHGMENAAYDGLRGVLVRRVDGDRWAVMPTDVTRAAHLRAFAEARRNGGTPARAADLSRPLKPLAIRAANLRPQLRDPRATVVPDTVAL